MDALAKQLNDLDAQPAREREANCEAVSTLAIWGLLLELPEAMFSPGTRHGMSEDDRVNSESRGAAWTRMRTETQKLTVPCPVDRRLAKVQVRCDVLDPTSAIRPERRILREIVACTFGRPGIACHPACEDTIRGCVEY